MMEKSNLDKMYFSYNQFMIFDEQIRLPGCEWTQEHSAQGFARRESTVCMNTLEEFGSAAVEVSCDKYRSDPDYDRVIAVPFKVVSGTVVIEGPEESKTGRIFHLPAGNYRLVVAQQALGDEEERIDLFFEPTAVPILSSEIIVADLELKPPLVLVENANIAEV
jgi:hypothetical protein